MKKIFALAAVFTGFIYFAQAQKPAVPTLERKITVHAENQPIEAVLADISNQAGFVFSYSPEAINSRNRTTIHASNKPVKLVLNNLFDDEVTFKTRGKYVILKKNPSSKSTEKQVIEGYITDSNSGEIVSDASIYSKDRLVSAVTDRYGYFKMEVPANNRIPSIYVSKLGYSDTILASRLDAQKRMVEISLNQQDSAAIKRKPKTGFQKLVPNWLIPKKIRIHSLNLNDSIFRSVQLSLLPMVSTNLFLTGNVENNFSLNATVGYVYGIKQLEIGGLLNIVRTNARYCQLAGIGNVVGGNFTGFQGAGILNYAHSAKGVQGAGIINTSLGNADIQVSGVINQSFSSMVQTSGTLNLALNAKVQVAGTANFAYKTNTVQVSGIINIANSTNTQVAGIINAAANSSGVQVAGITNVAFENSSIQISGIYNQSEQSNYQISGLINKVRHIKGLQLALINISDTCTGIPIGLFNYVNAGYHKLEFSFDETSMAALSFRSGTKFFHTIFTGGKSIKNTDKSLFTYGFGLGSSLGDQAKTLFDIDLTVNHWIYQNDHSFNNRLYRIYLGVDRRLFYKLSVAAGLTFNLLTCDSQSPYFADVYSKIPPYTISNRTNAAGTNVKTWIGGKIAFRLF